MSVKLTPILVVAKFFYMFKNIKLTLLNIMCGNCEFV